MKIQKAFTIKNSFEQAVICPICGKSAGLRQSDPAKGIESIAWFDPYVKGYTYKWPKSKTMTSDCKQKGAYVCSECLSQKRKDEIKKIDEQHKFMADYWIKSLNKS